MGWRLLQRGWWRDLVTAVGDTGGGCRGWRDRGFCGFGFRSSALLHQRRDPARRDPGRRHCRRVDFRSLRDPSAGSRLELTLVAC